MMLTRVTAQAEDIGLIDAALRAAYPAYTGLNYAAMRGLLRLQFSSIPSEEDQIAIGALVTRAPIFSRRVAGLFNRRPTWH